MLFFLTFLGCSSAIDIGDVSHLYRNVFNHQYNIKEYSRVFSKRKQELERHMLSYEPGTKLNANGLDIFRLRIASNQRLQNAHTY